jgi:hypothetical protein
MCDGSVATVHMIDREMNALRTRDLCASGPSSVLLISHSSSSLSLSSIHVLAIFIRVILMIFNALVVAESWWDDRDRDLWISWLRRMANAICRWQGFGWVADESRLRCDHR